MRQGARFADIGTDHAYLPIALALDGKIRGAVASDINEGPVERGRKNIEEHALSDKISGVLTDGLSGIEPYAPDDILILGMGGELIARILECAPWTKSANIRLCLQPMTHAEVLRRYLIERGFEITDEKIVREGDKLYQLILASHTTKKISPYSDEEFYLGRVNIQKKPDELSALASSVVAKLTRRAEGLALTGADTSELRTLIESIQKHQTQEN